MSDFSQLPEQAFLLCSFTSNGDFLNRFNQWDFFIVKFGIFSKTFHIFVRVVSWFLARTVQGASPVPFISTQGNPGTLLDQTFCLEGGAGI